MMRASYFDPANDKTVEIGRCSEADVPGLIDAILASIPAWPSDSGADDSAWGYPVAVNRWRAGLSRMDQHSRRFTSQRRQRPG